MRDPDRAATGGSHPSRGPNDRPIPSAGAPSDAVDAPLPSPGGHPLRDIGDQPDTGLPGGVPGGGVRDIPGHGGAEEERRDELAKRTGVGMPSPAGRDRPDLLPDVDPPELPM